MATSAVNLNSILTAINGNSSSSGIDVSSAVSQIIYAEAAPVRQWQSQQATLASQTTDLTTLNSLSSTLYDALNALQDPVGALTSLSVSSSNSSVVTASATSGTATGTHVITVANLASTASWYSTSVASSSTQLSEGSFTLQVGSGDVQTINVGGTSGVNTLDDLASYINGQNLGVDASVINDSTGARLAIVSQQSGKASDITMSGSTGTGTTGLSFTQGSKGLDASITVDGVPVTSASNTVTGAVNGLTINLLGTTSAGSQVNLTVAPDATAASDGINAFVTAFNNLVNQVNTEFTYNSSTKTSGPLAGDSVVRSLQAELLSAMSYSTGSSNGASTLYSMGITMNDDGTLSVDSTTLTNAIQNNFSAVQQFFQGTASNGFANAVNNQLNMFTDPTEGAFTLDLQSISAENTDLQNQINVFQDYLTNEQTRLTDEYNQADILLQQLPSQTAQIQAMLGNNSSSNG